LIEVLIFKAGLNYLTIQLLISFTVPISGVSLYLLIDGVDAEFYLSTLRWNQSIFYQGLLSRQTFITNLWA
jgi:hypothetical protein